MCRWIFQWCHSGDYNLLSNDPQHAADDGDLADAIALGADYGTPSVPLVYHWGHGFVKEERVHHAGHALVIQRALGTNFLTDLDQIVEFGGGTGDMAALVMDMGFPGTYYVCTDSLAHSLILLTTHHCSRSLSACNRCTIWRQ